MPTPAKLLAILLLSLFTVSCYPPTAISGADHAIQTPSLIPVTLNAPFSLKVNQIAQLNTENLQIKFVNVEEDSRCPPDIQCVWSGQVKIKIHVTQNSQNLNEIDLIIREKQKDLAIQTFTSYSIEITDIDPPPIPHKNLEISDYVATFYITKIEPD